MPNAELQAANAGTAAIWDPIKNEHNYEFSKINGKKKKNSNGILNKSTLPGTVPNVAPAAAKQAVTTAAHPINQHK